jgi:hypothetical protein
VAHGTLFTTPLIPEQLHIDQLVSARIVSTPVTDITVNATTKALTAIKATPPEFAPKWQRIVPPRNWSRIVRWIWSRNRNRKVSDFLYKLFNRRLQVGERRHYAEDVGCPCGLELETHQHLFTQCDVSKMYWRWFQQAWQHTTNHRLPFNNVSNVLFASVPPNRVRKDDRAKWRLLEIAHGEALYCVWLQRCRFVFDDELFDAQHIAALLRARIRLAIDSLPNLNKIDGFQALSTALIFNLDAPI